MLFSSDDGFHGERPVLFQALRFVHGYMALNARGDILYMISALSNWRQLVCFDG